jgi:tyrosinase
MTSPDDPVFFLHHCFIDKVWADWQAEQAKDNPTGAPHYAPEEQGPSGHNLRDQLKPWTRTVKDVLDISKLGYNYEQPPTQDKLIERAKTIRFTAGEVRQVPPNAAKSPFMAE